MTEGEIEELVTDALKETPDSELRESDVIFLCKVVARQTRARCFGILMKATQLIEMERDVRRDLDRFIMNMGTPSDE